MTTTPADTLRTAAERARQIGDPLHTALADWLEREGRQEVYTLAEFGHRSACAPALAVARQILAAATTTTGAQTDSLRDRIDGAVRTVPIKYGDGTIEPVSADEAAVIADAVMAVLPTGADRADLPDRLQATLTERFTALGNPFSEMRTQEKGPDGWPASHPVGPAGVAEVLRELLAAEQPTPTERAAIARVRAVLETEAVTGRTALEYRGLITGALMAAEAQQPAPAETDLTERPEDTARRFARRLNAVERLCSGRPGYHTITVKALLTAMSDADEEHPAP